jgi:hypothetical protein
MGRDPEAVQLTDPVSIDAADAGPCEGGEDVPVGQDDETRLECRDDFLLEPVGEVRGVEEDERQLVESVALLGEVDGRRHQLGARPAGLDDPVALDLEPLSKERNLGRAADAVGAFDSDDAPRVAFNRQVGDAVAVVARVTPADAPASTLCQLLDFLVDRLICRCCEANF